MSSVRDRYDRVLKLIFVMQDVVCMSAAIIMQVSQKCAYKVSNLLVFTASTVQIKEFLESKSDL